MIATRRLHRALAYIALALAVVACATWQSPPGVDDSTLRARATTADGRDVRVSAVMLGGETSRRMFGDDIDKANVRPVWIEVENRTSQPLRLLRTGADPDYFSPLEVAWSMHRKFSKRANARIDEHVQARAFHNPTPSGDTNAGVIFVNPQRGVTLLNIDLFGQKTLIPFSLVLFPDDYAGPPPLTLRRRYESVTDYTDLDALRSALEKLPCCASDAAGATSGDPLNLVMIGTVEDIGAASMRRNYRRDAQEIDDLQRVFGRGPDIVGRRHSQSGAPATRIRLWFAPMSYEGRAVFIAQVGRPPGGRFAPVADVGLHGDVDEARNFLVQDMMYSGGLEKLGFINGVGEAGGASPRSTFDGASYRTDGLRAVLFFATRPLSMSDVEVLDWVPYLERLEGAGHGQGDDARK